MKLKLDTPKSSEITPKSLYMNRRRFLAAAAGFGALALSAEKIEELLSPAGARLWREPGCTATPSPISTTGEKLTPYAGRDPLQQFLRVLHRQGRPVAAGRQLSSAALDGADRRAGEQAADAGLRFPAEAGAAGGARLPPSLRGRLVDGDSLDRVSAEGAAGPRAARLPRRSSWPLPRCCVPRRCRGSSATC